MQHVRGKHEKVSIIEFLPADCYNDSKRYIHRLFFYQLWWSAKFFHRKSKCRYKFACELLFIIHGSIHKLVVINSCDYLVMAKLQNGNSNS